MSSAGVSETSISKILPYLKYTHCPWVLGEVKGNLLWSLGPAVGSRYQHADESEAKGLVRRLKGAASA